MEYKTVPTVQELIENSNTIVGYASTTGVLDLGADITHKGAFKKSIREGFSRVKHLWQHDSSNPPIAKILELKEVGRDDLPEELLQRSPDIQGGLKVVREYLDTPRAQEVYTAIKAGAVTEMSYGYDPIKYDYTTIEENGLTVRNLREIKLYDTSDVLWGMNPFTMASAKSIFYQSTGIDRANLPVNGELKDFNTSSIDFRNFTEPEKERIALHFAYSATYPIQDFDDLKFLHHLPAFKSVGLASLPWVKRSMVDLIQSDILLEQAFPIYSHLASHYTEAGETAPSFSSIMLAKAAAKAIANPEDIKVGRVLSAANLDKVKNALAVLSELLLAAEPPQDLETEKALTLAVLGKLTKARIAQRL